MNFPSGTFIFTNVRGLQRHPQHWERPLGFDPDRFLSNKDKIVKSSFLTFGGGARACPGNFFKKFVAKLKLKQ